MVRLESLAIEQVYSFELLNEITSQLTGLTHLRLCVNSRKDIEEEDRVFMTTIWSISMAWKTRKMD